VKAERIFFNHPTVVASQSGKYISDRKKKTGEIISNKSYCGLAAMGISCWGWFTITITSGLVKIPKVNHHMSYLGISYWGIVTSSPAEFLSAL
jgi:hypothetical protein